MNKKWKCITKYCTLYNWKEGTVPTVCVLSNKLIKTMFEEADVRFVWIVRLSQITQSQFNSNI